MFDQAVEVPATEPVARLSARALQFGGIHALELLPGRLALHFPSVLTPAECAELIAGVYAAREAWTEEPAGHQYTLGRSYHLHHEQQREEEYFAQAASADALVRRSTPGLQGRMVALLRLLVKDRVAQRAGCWPRVAASSRLLSGSRLSMLSSKSISPARPWRRASWALRATRPGVSK